MNHTLTDIMVLSIFPGIDLLGRAFEETGFCVVRGPDLITGGDIRTFKPPKGRFQGVIGGPPCQDYSKLNRAPGVYSDSMMDEYIRVVLDSGAEWFLYENVVTAPPFEIPGYQQQRFALDLAWFSDFSRNRVFVLGSKSGRFINPTQDVRQTSKGACVTGSDTRSFSACCEIQGLPANFDIPFFTLAGKKQAVANAVPLPLGRHVAQLIAQTLYGFDALPRQTVAARRCRCGCGRIVVGRARYNSSACRKRAQRHRDSVRAACL